MSITEARPEDHALVTLEAPEQSLAAGARLRVEWLLALVAEQPDLTLDEIVAAMRKQAVAPRVSV